MNKGIQGYIVSRIQRYRNIGVHITHGYRDIEIQKTTLCVNKHKYNKTDNTDTEKA